MKTQGYVFAQWSRIFAYWHYGINATIQDTRYWSFVIPMSSSFRFEDVDSLGHKQDIFL